MDDPDKAELVAAWLRAAEEDIGAASKLIEGNDVYPGTATYHCQQCAEKALKAFLLENGVPFEKTHNLSLLARMCQDKSPLFQSLSDHAEALTPYATLYRYPEEIEPADMEQARTAIAMAREVLKVVRTLLHRAP